MSKWKWVCPLVFLLLVALPFSVAQATEIFLYNESVADEVDLSAYLADGIVQAPDGKGFFQWVHAGHAPDPYPSIMIPEKGIEQMGASSVEMDGVIFINHGRNLVKNKKAIVLWTVRIPNANARLADEFQEDLTLSLWVDWNQDQMWREDELAIRHHLNLFDQFPTADNEIVVYYLDSFLVPDITGLMNANEKGGNKDVRNIWARSVLSCDDPDVSPDGAQIFGEYEDYMLAYLITPRMYGRQQ